MKRIFIFGLLFAVVFAPPIFVATAQETDNSTASTTEALRVLRQELNQIIAQLIIALQQKQNYQPNYYGSQGYQPTGDNYGGGNQGGSSGGKSGGGSKSSNPLSSFLSNLLKQKSGGAPGGGGCTGAGCQAPGAIAAGDQPVAPVAPTAPAPAVSQATDIEGALPSGLTKAGPNDKIQDHPLNVQSKDDPTRKDSEITTIVLHGSFNDNDGEIFDTQKIFTAWETSGGQGKSGFGPHYAILRDGQIVRTLEDGKVANHAGGPNSTVSGINHNSIGVEIIQGDQKYMDNRDNKETLSNYEKQVSTGWDKAAPLQYAGLDNLIKELKKNHQSIKTITLHCLVNRVKTDPANFDWSKVEATLKEVGISHPTKTCETKI